MQGRSSLPGNQRARRDEFLDFLGHGSLYNSNSSSNVWWVFPHHGAVLRHQLGALQFSLILTLSAWRER